ncbi:hypothetical protein CYMTET_8146 [Cymbomonas tetramitiformis]|uniref:Uncharacterized protein n=1 Tax=Cymbomonas tetramitiformis TaxID=36881 RepID=A0AAE0GTS6_9CHLO|nr:hypothetical protein CYMTET_8146 [Cymbomonas tetramitiformis]
MADAAAKEAAEDQEGTFTIDPWVNKTMVYALAANARDGDSLRSLVGNGAVERYVAVRIAANAAQHPATSKWMQPQPDLWEELGPDESMRTHDPRTPLEGGEE